MRKWTAEEARRFLAATRSDRLGVGWALLLTQGLRRGELCGLRWTAVDFDRDALRVVATRVVVDGVPTDSVLKTKAGVRSIPLDDKLVGMLRAHRAASGPREVAGRPAYEDGDYVLADELGRPYHPDTVSEWFEQRREQLGFAAHTASRHPSHRHVSHAGVWNAGEGRSGNARPQLPDDHSGDLRACPARHGRGGRRKAQRNGARLIDGIGKGRKLALRKLAGVLRSREQARGAARARTVVPPSRPMELTPPSKSSTKALHVKKVMG